MKHNIKKIIPNVILNKYHEFNKQKEIKQYAGNDVKCPICNSEFSSFALYSNRENARCLNCESLERHRLLWLYLNKETNLMNENLKLLHFAPEKVFYIKFSSKSNIKYYPCDLFPEHYDHKGHVEIIKVDITNIPFEDNYFDVILCNHVLEHIPNDSVAMRELYRVMKKGAWGIFQVPIDYNLKTTFEDSSINTPEGREKAFGLSDHYRLYGSDYKDRLKEAGFDITEDNFIETISSVDKVKFGLCSSELIYLGRK